MQSNSCLITVRWLAVCRALLSTGILVAFSYHACSEQARAAERQPNILFLIADDLGWRDVGYHGSEIRTPELDRLAREGVRLEHHDVYPTCSPMRAGLLAGRNPACFGIHEPIAGRSQAALPTTTPTLAGVLRSRGYETALMGKWHLGLRPEVGPRQYGFDQTYGYFHGQIDQYTHRYKNGDRTWHRNDVFVDEEGHATDLIAAEAVRLIQAKRQKPFFLWVAFSVPHVPLQEEEKWAAPYKESIADPSRRVFAASVTHMDAAIGRIVAALEQSGQLDNTLVVFTSDNGGQKNQARSKEEYEGKHGPFPILGDNRPLRGWKGEVYEGGVRVPALVYWRGRLAPRVVQQQISLVDWLPTLAHLAGAAVGKDWKIEGRDVWPVIVGEMNALEPRVAYWDIGIATAVEYDGWKLIIPAGKGEGVELYYLANDPAEKENVAQKNPEKVAELRKLLSQRLRAAKPHSK